MDVTLTSALLDILYIYIYIYLYNIQYTSTTK